MGCKQVRSGQVIYVIVRSFIIDIWNTRAALFTGVLTFVNVEMSTSSSGIKLAHFFFYCQLCNETHMVTCTHTLSHAHTHTQECA